MTLTIEQVRDTRFHLARRNGYEPVDVDNFADAVESTLNELYKKILTEYADDPKFIAKFKASDEYEQTSDYEARTLEFVLQKMFEDGVFGDVVCSGRGAAVQLRGDLPPAAEHIR